MDINLVKNKMDIAINFFEKEISSIRTSRANPSILDNILVDSYGNKTPLNQLANISAPEANLITIQVWDNTLINIVEKAINESNLGINPQVDGQLIRLPIPKLSEERRQELAKVASQYGEKAKVAIRNNRRDELASEYRCRCCLEAWFQHPWAEAGALSIWPRAQPWDVCCSVKARGMITFSSSPMV